METKDVILKTGRKVYVFAEVGMNDQGIKIYADCSNNKIMTKRDIEQINPKPETRIWLEDGCNE